MASSHSIARTLDTLPDDVLRDIFAFCVSCTDEDPQLRMQSWQTLVQVCKQWRETIYASRHFLDLFLCISDEHRVGETIDSWPWPEFPLVLDFYVVEEGSPNFCAALAHRDRIRRIRIVMVGQDVDWFVELMEEEFPQLTHLDLTGESRYDLDHVPSISFGRFLGGSAPSLQYLSIGSFYYEGLPSLLSSAPNLVSLKIRDIRLSCYMSPEALVGALAGLTKLRELIVGYSSLIPTDQFRNARGFQNLHPPTHAVFPALTKLQIEGDNEYMEDLINAIDAPRLEGLHVEYPKPEEDEVIRAGHLSQFIGRTESFKHAQFRRALVALKHHDTSVVLDLPRGEYQRARLSHMILYQEDSTVPPVDTVSHVISWLNQLVMILSDVQHLSIEGTGSKDEEKNSVLESVDWLPLLCSFSAVEVLHVSGELVKHLASALDHTLEEMVAQVLPALQLLWLDDGRCNKKGKGKPESVDRFLSLRKQSGRPVVVVKSRDEFIERLNLHQLELSESPQKIFYGGYEYDDEM